MEASEMATGRLSIGSANAAVYKRTPEQNITLTVEAISKNATMTLENYPGSFSGGEYLFVCAQRRVSLC